MKANCFFVVVVILQIWFSLPFEEAVTGFCSSQTWRIRQYSHFPLFFFYCTIKLVYLVRESCSYQAGLLSEVMQTKTKRITCTLEEL